MSRLPHRLTLAVFVTLLAACRREAPPTPAPPAEPTAKVSSPAAEIPSASDRGNAPPALGAVTAGQDQGGHSGRPIQPSGGDGMPAASAPASRASPP